MLAAGEGAEICRTPQGVRGLKPVERGIRSRSAPSHSARSAWIETSALGILLTIRFCRTPQGVRGLKPAPGARRERPGKVALRKECVD